jgi:ANTAR domain
VHQPLNHSSRGLQLELEPVFVRQAERNRSSAARFSSPRQNSSTRGAVLITNRQSVSVHNWQCGILRTASHHDRVSTCQRADGRAREDQAFTVLQEISQRTNIKLHHVAAIIVATGSSTTTQIDNEVAQAVLAAVRHTGLGGPFSAGTAAGMS